MANKWIQYLARTGITGQRVNVFPEFGGTALNVSGPLTPGERTSDAIGTYQALMTDLISTNPQTVRINVMNPDGVHLDAAYYCDLYEVNGVYICADGNTALQLAAAEQNVPVSPIRPE